MAIAISKYRPSLSAHQILHIIHLTRTEQPRTALGDSLLATLIPFQAKIEAGLKRVSHFSEEIPELVLLDSLGGELSAPSYPKILSDISPNSFATKESYWLACYNRYVETPEECSISEVAGAKEYMYLKDLMSEEEKSEFELHGN